MIQAVNSVQPSYTNTKAASFKRNEFQEPSVDKQHSKLAGTARWAGAQFACGALVSGLLSGITNITAKVKKTPDNMIPLKEIGKRAAVWGGIWIAMGLIIDGVFGAMAKKNQNR